MCILKQIFPKNYKWVVYFFKTKKNLKLCNLAMVLLISTFLCRLPWTLVICNPGELSAVSMRIKLSSVLSISTKKISPPKCCARDSSTQYNFFQCCARDSSTQYNFFQICRGVWETYRIDNLNNISYCSLACFQYLSPRLGCKVLVQRLTLDSSPSPVIRWTLGAALRQVASASTTTLTA